MIPEITLISSGKGIINNWSLHYIEKQKEITYTTSNYSFTFHLLCYCYSNYSFPFGTIYQSI